MDRKIVRYFLITFAYLAVLIPLWMRVKDLDWTYANLFQNLFPTFGILAFTLLWLHVAGAAFEPWLNRHINFETFVNNTSNLILFFFILHPLLLFLSFGSLNSIYAVYNPLYVRLGAIGLLLLLTFDVGRALKRREFFVRHWNKILIISTIGFIFIFFHSLNIGSDLQSGPLRFIWIFYGITAIISTIYTYLIKKT